MNEGQVVQLVNASHGVRVAGMRAKAVLTTIVYVDAGPPAQSQRIARLCSAEAARKECGDGDARWQERGTYRALLLSPSS